MKHLAIPVLIDGPGLDCSRPANERLCLVTAGCPDALTPRLGRHGYHYTRCGRDGFDIEAIEEAIPDPPKSGPEVIPIRPRRPVFPVQLCKDPETTRPRLPADAIERRVARWEAIVGRPRVRRERVLVGAPRRRRCRALFPAWRQGWCCSQTDCRYHLSDLGGTPVAPGCGLLVADGAPQTRAQIGAFVGVTPESIRQIEARALERKSLERLLLFAEGASPDRTATSVEDRCLRALRSGSCTTVELAEPLGLNAGRVRDALRRLEAAGAVVGTSLGCDKSGIEWSMVDRVQRLDAAEEC